MSSTMTTGKFTIGNRFIIGDTEYYNQKEMSEVFVNTDESEVNKMDNYNKVYESGFQEGWEYAMKLFTRYWRPDESNEKYIEILKNIFWNKDITSLDYVFDHYNMIQIRNKIEEFEAEIRSLEIGDEFESVYGLYGLIIGFAESDPNIIIYIGYSDAWNEFYYGEVDKYTIRKRGGEYTVRVRKGESKSSLKTYLKNKITPPKEDEDKENG